MKKIHFIAVGGSIMHQLAIALQEKGYQITGSDDEFYEPALSHLRNHHLLPIPGWHPDLITEDLDAVILGMHARSDNPELLKATALQLPVYSFPEYIYEESKNKTRVVIGGSHGKTTITSMIMHVLHQNNRTFDFLVGAQIKGINRSVKISEAPLIICEGDEYPASAIKKIPKFLFYHPQIAVLSGIAWDHINVFPTYEDYVNQFQLFIQQLADGSMLIYNETDDVLSRLVMQYGRHLDAVPYHLPKHTITEGVTKLTIDGITVPLKTFGHHNLLNLQAAYLVCKKLDVPTHSFLLAIKHFEGASSRLEKIFENKKSILFRDFAHAPSKVKASIDAVKNQFPDRKLIAVLELHTYSSLNKDFLPQYAHAMDAADSAAVFYSPHALQIKQLPAITAKQVKEGFQREDIEILHAKEDLKRFLSVQNASPANLLMMSSGSFDHFLNEEMKDYWGKITNDML